MRNGAAGNKHLVLSSFVQNPNWSQLSGAVAPALACIACPLSVPRPNKAIRTVLLLMIIVGTIPDADFKVRSTHSFNDFRIALYRYTQLVVCQTHILIKVNGQVSKNRVEVSVIADFRDDEPELLCAIRSCFLRFVAFLMKRHVSPC